MRIASESLILISSKSRQFSNFDRSLFEVNWLIFVLVGAGFLLSFAVVLRVLQLIVEPPVCRLQNRLVSFLRRLEIRQVNVLRLKT